MEIFVQKEIDQAETRVALIPVGVEKLVALGFTVKIESGAGAKSDYRDSEYAEAGAAIMTDRRAALAGWSNRNRHPHAARRGALSGG